MYSSDCKITVYIVRMQLLIGHATIGTPPSRKSHIHYPIQNVFPLQLSRDDDSNNVIVIFQIIYEINKIVSKQIIFGFAAKPTPHLKNHSDTCIHRYHIIICCRIKYNTHIIKFKKNLLVLNTNIVNNKCESTEKIRKPLR